jgi:hypothetical protein
VQVRVVQNPAVSSIKPADFADAIWDNDGWLVPVEWRRPPILVRPKDILDKLRPHLPAKYSPIQGESGNGLQSVYLAAVPNLMAVELLRPLAGWEPTSTVIAGRTISSENAIEQLDDKIEAEIKNDTDIDETERQALVLARRGQGRFRKNLSNFESKCRVTNVSDARLLRASHIKPWRACSTNHERLDGNNGLLLAPHVDLLFDRGYISFEGDGRLLRSPRVDPSELILLGIPTDDGFSVGPFNASQAQYLDFHRTSVFLRQLVDE